MRYDQLIEAVRKKHPQAILEVGTWNGGRALDMLQVAPLAKYYGFDLFEDADKETDAVEFNVKRHVRLADVSLLLRDYDVNLYKGNTRETLPAFASTFADKVDFVWIDGGHSVETIRSDWENVQRVLEIDARVYFDDYYTGGPDTEKVGCNRIVAELSHEILPIKDPVVGGGWVQMVRVYPNE